MVSCSQATGPTLVQECRPRAKLLLLGNMPAAMPTLDIQIPSRPNTVTRSAGIGVCLWLRPDQRLLLLDPGCERDALVSQLHALQAPDFYVLDAGARFVEFAVEGSNSRALINAGCGIDLRDAAFALDTSAQSRCDQIPFLLFRSSRDRFELLVERPLADHFRLWMRTAANNL
jgi:sarcosine oxidase, subunit gamma